MQIKISLLLAVSGVSRPSVSLAGSSLPSLVSVSAGVGSGDVKSIRKTGDHQRTVQGLFSKDTIEGVKTNRRFWGELRGSQLKDTRKSAQYMKTLVGNRE